MPTIQITPYFIGVWLFRLIVGGMIVIVVIGVTLATVVGAVVDFWRFWYGTLIVVVAIASARFFFSGFTTKTRKWQLLVICFWCFAVAVISSPYITVEVQIRNGNWQFFDHGTGIWKCEGDYQWFFTYFFDEDSRCYGLRDSE